MGGRSEFFLPSETQNEFSLFIKKQNVIMLMGQEGLAVQTVNQHQIKILH